MKFLQSLSESKLLSSTSSYRKYTAKQIAELVYLHVIGLRILASEPLTQAWAHDYAVRSARYLGFTKWYQNATDLHLLLHALISEDVELKMPEKSLEFKETLYFDETEIKRWLKDMCRGHINEPHTRSLFLHMDGQFQIKDSSMKAIRRIVQDWPRNTQRQKQLAMTRLLQIMRNRCRLSDVLVQLNHLAEELKLELENVANRETGDEAVHDGSDPDFIEQKPKKSGGWLGGTAAVVGSILGYHTVKNLVKESEEDEDSIEAAERTLEEDDGGGAAACTTSGDIAQVTKPMMTTQRRIPRKKAKKR